MWRERVGLTPSLMVLVKPANLSFNVNVLITLHSRCWVLCGLDSPESSKQEYWRPSNEAGHVLNGHYASCKIHNKIYNKSLPMDSWTPRVGYIRNEQKAFNWNVPIHFPWITLFSRKLILEIIWKLQSCIVKHCSDCFLSLKQKKQKTNIHYYHCYYLQ